MIRGGWTLTKQRILKVLKDFFFYQSLLQTYFLLILKHRICLLFSLAANFCDGIQLRFYRAFISNPTQRFKSLEWPNDWRQNAWKVTSQLEYLYQYWGFWILLNYLHAFRYSGLLFLHYSCSFIFFSLFFKP